LDELEAVLKQVAGQPAFSSIVWQEGQLWLKRSYRLRPDEVPLLLRQQTTPARFSIHREQGDTRTVIIETPLAGVDDGGQSPPNLPNPLGRAAGSDVVE